MEYEIILGDCREVFSKFKNKFTLIFNDFPYFLSNDGITCQSGDFSSVNKGEWDKSNTENKLDFYRSCLKIAYNSIEENGSLILSGTHHCIHDICVIAKKIGFNLVQDIIWFKPNAPPNLSCVQFTDSQETLLWMCKGDRPKFNYERMKVWDVSKDKINKFGKQMRSVWSIPLTPQKEKFGFCKDCKLHYPFKDRELHESCNSVEHKTQKPLELLNRVVCAFSDEGDWVGDMFAGTGTTCYSAIDNRRKVITCDINKDYLAITKYRIKSLLSNFHEDINTYLK